MKPTNEIDQKLTQNKEMITLSKLDDSQQWNLIWEDSFKLPDIDASKWNFVEGGWGFGNEESQYYTARKENARIENGMLILEARQEAYEKMDYTSAKLTTKGKAAWKYGRFSIRAKLPEGQDKERLTGLLNLRRTSHE
jgi:beta-glucanase (GH16 family)